MGEREREIICAQRQDSKESNSCTYTLNVKSITREQISFSSIRWLEWASTDINERERIHTKQISNQFQSTSNMPLTLNKAHLKQRWCP